VRRIPCGLSNEVSLDIPFHLKKKVGGGCALPGADMQKPYASKCGQGKIKIGLFREFFTKIAYFQVVNFIPVKVSTLYNNYIRLIISEFSNKVTTLTGKKKRNTN
jgi:hypothetical protein